MAVSTVGASRAHALHGSRPRSPRSRSREEGESMRQAVRVAPHIFRQYDIRGVVGEDLDEAVAEQVGRAYGTLIREATGRKDPTVVTGQDNRPSSPALGAALIRGLRDAGVNVTDIGTSPTPRTP